MKKLTTTIAVVALGTLLATPANAALTTALPDGEALWVMGVGDGAPLAGDIRELDPASGTFTDVFLDSTVLSNSYNVGADYDPTTDSVYWIKDFGNLTQSIVRYSVSTGEETVFATEGDTYDIRGIDVTDGILRVSAYDSIGGGGNDIIATVTLDENAGTGSFTDIVNLGASASQSAMAIDPADDQMYLLTYSCELYTVDGSTRTLVTNLSELALGVNEACIALDFDSSGRAWMTHNETGSTASFVPSDIENSLETSEWETPAYDEYGEALFVYNGDPADEDTLASTGFDLGVIGLGAAALISLGVVARLRRRVQ